MNASTACPTPLFQNVPVPVVIFDKNEIILSSNLQANMEFGNKENSLIGKRIRDLVPSNDMEDEAHKASKKIKEVAPEVLYSKFLVLSFKDNNSLFILCPKNPNWPFLEHINALAQTILSQKLLKNSSMIPLQSTFEEYMEESELSEAIKKELLSAPSFQEKLSKKTEDSSIIDDFSRELELKLEQYRNLSQIEKKAFYKLNEFKILVVDDNLTNQKILQKLLEKKGLKTIIEFANDGKEALEKFKSAANSEKPYHVVFMDIEMPLMNGLYAAFYMRGFEKERGLSHIPIIGSSANIQADFEQGAVYSTMSPFIKKPYTSFAVGEALETHFVFLKEDEMQASDKQLTISKS